MIPGPNQIIECPACGKRQLRRTLRSGNTFGARYFSDGKRVADMLPDFPYFVKCPACDVFFKITAKLIVGEISRHEIAENRDKIQFVRFLTVNEYRQAISVGLYNGNEKDILPLRVSLWRLYNDCNDGERRSKTLSENRQSFDAVKTYEIKENEDYVENCREILSLMVEKTEDEDLLLRAELWRNLGEFEKCKSLLNDVKMPEKYERYISSIRAACDVESTLTVEI